MQPSQIYQQLCASWNAMFGVRQNVNLETENEPYVQFMINNFGTNDYSAETSDGSREQRAESLSDIATIFMKGGEELNSFHDQTDVVAGFCSQMALSDLPSYNSKPCALLDDRTSTTSVGGSRKYKGILNSSELYEESKKPRFAAGESNDLDPSNSEVDADRRLVYIANVDPGSILAVIGAASRTQAPALKDLIYNHITRKAGLSVAISTLGLRTFALSFHLPFYARRQKEQLRADKRKLPNGSPLRRALAIPALPPLHNSLPSVGYEDSGEMLYEASCSVTVTGIDNWRWTGYCFDDNYYEDRDILEEYDDMATETARPDPLSMGLLNVEDPVWMPRAYYLKILQIRSHRSLKEWQYVLDLLQERAEEARSRMGDLVDTSHPPGSETLTRVRQFSTWTTQMISLTRQLSSCLDKSILAWEDFQQRDINFFFSYQSDQPRTTSQNQLLTIHDIDKSFSQLKLINGTLRDLSTELENGWPEKVRLQLNLESNNVTEIQRNIADHVRTLTCIVILFCPLVLTTTLFGTQKGVLPFVLNFETFVSTIFVLLPSTICLAILLTWVDWKKPLFSFVKGARMGDPIRKSSFGYKKLPTDNVEENGMQPADEYDGDSSSLVGTLEWEVANENWSEGDIV